MHAYSHCQQGQRGPGSQPSHHKSRFITVAGVWITVCCCSEVLLESWGVQGTRHSSESRRRAATTKINYNHTHRQGRPTEVARHGLVRCQRQCATHGALARRRGGGGGSCPSACCCARPASGPRVWGNDDGPQTARWAAWGSAAAHPHASRLGTHASDAAAATTAAAATARPAPIPAAATATAVCT